MPCMSPAVAEGAPWFLTTDKFVLRRLKDTPRSALRTLSISLTKWRYPVTRSDAEIRHEGFRLLFEQLGPWKLSDFSP